MRLSNELTKTATCMNRRNVITSSVTNHSIFAGCVKNICHRLLKKEIIPDIYAALDAKLEEKGYFWENKNQKEKTMKAYVHYIERYVKSEGRVLEFPAATEMVNVFGEDIIILPDFIVKNGDTIEVCKIKTSGAGTQKSAEESLELYAFTKWALQKYPGAKNVSASYYHLKGKSDTGKNAVFTLDYYDSDATDKKLTQIYQPQREEFFKEQFEELYHPKSACSATDCIGCPQNNICNYQEAKIPSKEPRAVKPLGDILLTDAQEEAIDFDEGIARINAGAGAGKTLVVAMRIVSLLSKGVKPEDICLLTFTNTGAEEMTERVKVYCEEMGLDTDTSLITSATFNSFCQKILEKNYMKLGFLEEPTVIDDETKCGIIKEIMDRYPEIPEWDYVNFGMQMAYTKGALWSAVECFSLIKANGYTELNNPFKTLGTNSVKTLFQMYQDFNNTMHSRNLVEFDDQILMTFELLKSDPGLFDAMGFQHIIVDEFQDTDLQQINLLKELIDTPDFKSFMAVGDDSQAIFSFRNTSPEYLINFFKYFGEGKDFYLLDNHRSQAEIIHMGNKINAMNVNRVEKDLIPSKPAGMKPLVNGFYTSEQEYAYLVEQIKLKIANGKNPSDIAFIASNRYELQKMQDLLAKEGIPVIMMNPEPYIENSRVCALLSFAETFTKGTTQGALDLLNVALGGKMLEHTDREIESMLNDFMIQLEKEPATKEAFMDLVEQMDPEKDDETFQSFLEKLNRKRSIKELSSYLHDFSMYGQKSCHKKEARYEGVVLTTAHSSKGMEWDTVFCSLSKFDSERLHLGKKENVAEKEEKRRLVFVTLTRAKEELYVTGEYQAYINDKEGRVYNQFLRDCYTATGKVFAPDANQYIILQKKKQIENAEKRAKAKGLKLESLVKRTKQREDALEELKKEYAAFAPGKDFLTEHGISSYDLLETKDVNDYLDMYKRENLKSRIENIMTTSYKKKTLDQVALIKDATKLKTKEMEALADNLDFLKDKSDAQVEEYKKAMDMGYASNRQMFIYSLARQAVKLEPAYETYLKQQAKKAAEEKEDDEKEP